MKSSRLERLASFLFVAIGMIATGFAFFLIFFRSQF